MPRDGKPRLPYGQLAVLSLCRLAEPIALTSVFPYLPEMIESFGVGKADVAKWAGITSAVFSFSQCLTGIPLGTASDVVGRKPTLLLGLSLVMVSTLMFGFSQSLLWAIIARGIAGAGSGTVGISRTTVAEMVPEKELQPMAFSVMPLMWSIGSIVGPTFGGMLASPVQRYPDLFGKSEFLERFPYSLPNLISGAIFLIGVSVGVLFLRETLQTRRKSTDYGLVVGNMIAKPFTKKSRSRKSLHDSENSPHDSPRLKPRKTLKPVRYREVFNVQSSLNLLSYTILALHSIAFDQLVPVFLHLPPQTDMSERSLPFKFAGGFGLNSGQIGIIFTLYAVFALLCQFLVYPPAANYFGVLRSFRAVSLLAPFAYLIMPFTVLLPTYLQQPAVLVVMCTKCIVGVFSFPCSMILLTNSVSSLRLLGTLNGVATSISAIGRGIGPAFAGWTFSLGIKAGYVIVPWWILSVFGLLGYTATLFLVEMEGPVPDEEVEEVAASQDEGQEQQPLLGTERAYETARRYDGVSDE